MSASALYSFYAWFNIWIDFIDCFMSTRVNVLHLVIFSERERICYRPSVCRLSVTLVRPTQVVQIFGNISTVLDTLTIH